MSPAPALMAPPAPLWRQASLAALAALVLLLVILGLRLESAQTGLFLLPRPLTLAWAVIGTGLVAYAVLALRRGRWRPALLLGLAVALPLWAALLAGPGTWLYRVLPFDLAPINYGAAGLPLVVALRALLLARGGVARAPDPRAAVRARLAERIVGLLLLGFALVLPFLWFADRQLVDIATIILVYVMLGWGLNIVVGLAGLLDLGYVAFYAVGAYTYALLSTTFGLSFWLCLPLAGLMAALFGVLLGFPVLRLRGDYLAIVTLGFGEIVRIVLVNWWQFTGGPNGIGEIPRPDFFGLPFVRNPPEGGQSFASFFGLEFSTYHRVAFLYYVILACALLTNWFSIRARRLPLGRAWEALREDETACRALGLNPTIVKLAAFGCGAMFAGLAGSFFAARQGFISPESFVFLESAVILAIVVLGGLGSQLGIVVSASLLIGIPEVFRELEEYRMTAFGLVMVLIMLWRPGGLVAERQPSVRLSQLRAGPRP